MINILYMANGRSLVAPDGPLPNALRQLAELHILEHGKDLSDADALARMQ